MKGEAGVSLHAGSVSIMACHKLSAVDAASQNLM
jgi:hypothetical protein